MSAPLDNTQAHLAEARAFARSLNLVVKYAKLYGIDHGRTLAQMDAAWGELSAVISRTGHPGLLLGAVEEELFVDGEPLRGAASERAFARLLSTAKVASLQFSPAVTFAEFARFAFALGSAAGPQELGPALKTALGGYSGIRINEIRFVTAETNTPVLMFPGDVPPVAGNDRSAPQWLYDADELLRLMTAAEASASGGVKLAPAAADALEDIQEERDLVAVLRVLAQLGESANTPGGAPADEVVPKLPSPMRTALHSAAARLAHTAGKAETPLLVQLAELVAIRFAVRGWERGEIPLPKVPALLQRAAREICDLHRVVTALDPRAPSSPIPPQFVAQHLGSEFWAAVPEMARQRVLVSEEAWCVPAREVAEHVERLLSRSSIDSARHVLRRYCLSVTSADAEARSRAAAGVHELASLFAQVDIRLLGTAIRDVAWQLGRESDPGVRRDLAAAFARLGDEAAAFHRYAAFDQGLAALEQLERAQPALGKDLREQLAAEERVPAMVEAALQSQTVAPEVLRILRRMPAAAARCMAERFSRAARAIERERIVSLARELGASATTQLAQSLQSGEAADAVVTLGLLSRLVPELVENVLPERLPHWEPSLHGAVVAQLSISGAEQRGRMLVALLNALDSLALPQALDEIGMSGESSAAPKLMEIAFGLPEASTPYLQVKAIEALGRLRVRAAALHLARIVGERELFRWTHPNEMRIAAAEALAAIDAETFRAVPAARVLAMAAMSEPAANEEWARQRRYVRVVPPNPCRGLATSPDAAMPLDITSLSLCGGLATVEKGTASRHATLELPLGMRKVKAEVIMHDCGPRKVSFEIVNMGLEDRRKLRRFLVSQMPVLPRSVPAAS